MRILYLDLDTLRPDHLGCYGYARATSPHMDRIAHEGVRFENVYCSDAPCLPSRSALQTGRLGIHTGVVGHGGTAADLRLEGSSRHFKSRLNQECLPAILRRAGLKTALISPFADRHSCWHFYAGYNEMLDTGKGGQESAEEVTPHALDWLARNGSGENWFLHVNYWDAHTPYRAPLSFGNPFEKAPLPVWLTEEVLAQHLKMVGPHGAREISMYDNRTDPNLPRQPGEILDMGGLRRMMDGYDCGIRYMDGHIGHLLEALEELGVLDQTAIVVSADHGENFGELGLYGEHATADLPTCRVPFIVRWPGLQRGTVDRGLHYQLDWVPTLADLMGEPPRPAWDGQSFAAALRSGRDAGRDSLVLSQCAHVCQRSVRFDRWIYLRTYHDGYHLFPREMLFDAESDPYEQRDLAPSRPDLLQQAARLLLDWQDDMMLKSDSPVDPLWTVLSEGGPEHARGQLQKYCAFLEKTGRGWAIPELRRRHPGEFR